MEAIIERDKWSESSQSSWGSPYDSCATHYENISCRCRKCEVSFLFTALEQKEAFEVRKEFVWKKPYLCRQCESKWKDLFIELQEINEQWNIDREKHASDLEFLENWRFKLKEIHKYKRKGASSTHLVMLNRLLNKLVR